MTNLEPIVRKLIESNMYYSEEIKNIGSSNSYVERIYHIRYREQSFEKIHQLDESISQVVDWFYFHVLQLEMKDKEA